MNKIKKNPSMLLLFTCSAIFTSVFESDETIEEEEEEEEDTTD